MDRQAGAGTKDELSRVGSPPPSGAAVHCGGSARPELSRGPGPRAGAVRGSDRPARAPRARQLPAPRLPGTLPAPALWLPTSLNPGAQRLKEVMVFAPGTLLPSFPADVRARSGAGGERTRREGL